MMFTIKIIIIKLNGRAKIKKKYKLTKVYLNLRP